VLRCRLFPSVSDLSLRRVDPAPYPTVNRVFFPEISAATWGRSSLASNRAWERESFFHRARLSSRTDGLRLPGRFSASCSPYFNENFPLRDGIPLTVGLADGTSGEIQSPVINTVAGAIAIQEVVKSTEWVGQQGSPAAYAPHVRRDPLAGVHAKSVIYLFGKGDQGAANPNATAILRAGDLADRATFYRNDLAVAEDSRVPRDPHTFRIRIDSTVPLVVEVARGAQERIATFFASDGQEVIHPEPARFFELPIVLPLPEALNFIQQ